MTQPPDKEDAIRKLIQQTVASMGDVSPERLPHLLRERLKGQIDGDLDLHRYLQDVEAERQRTPQPKK